MKKFVIHLAMKLITLFGLVMSVLAYALMTTTLELAAMRDARNNVPMYMHPTWMPRDMGMLIGEAHVSYVLPAVIVSLMVVFWITIMIASVKVRHEFPREKYTWKA